MLIRWKTTEDTPLRYVEAGTVADTDAELAKRLIADGMAEQVKPPADKPKAEKAVRK